MSGKEKPHSAEYFGEARDFWWNADFMALMAGRWQLSRARSILDAGCGIGHWGRSLSPFLSPDAALTGVDREPAWVEKAAAIAQDKGLARFRYLRGDANALPFDDAQFDLVTCQTLLIHVPDPRATLREFMRVLKPGGLMVLSEPNNLAGSLVRDSSNFDGDIGALTDAVRLQALCERGKAALGRGNNSVGDLLPGLLHGTGLEDIQAYLSDKATLTLPHQSTPGQAAALAETGDWLARDIWCWEKAETESYFRAGGGDPAEFAKLWDNVMDRQRASFRAAKEERLSAVAAGLQYLISGRKPAA
ncbi:MAG: class I SAM-dependent methyltransferase [Elusimicrobia bacterium]|nr:class I SAM-dependent methyltransferase [Elusimicrobiota bacterium]